MTAAGRQAPGSVADEAARLAEALQDWAARRGEGVAGLLAGLDGHIATGSVECRLCPICRVIAVAREAGPDVYDHLADAAAAFLQAVRALADATRGEATPGGVEHIDIDDSNDDEAEEDAWD